MTNGSRSKRDESTHPTKTRTALKCFSHRHSSPLLKTSASQRHSPRTTHKRPTMPIYANTRHCAKYDDSLSEQGSNHARDHPRVIQAQSGRNCSVHATNNALQRIVVTETDAEYSIRQRFDHINNHSKSMARKREKMRAVGLTPTKLDWHTFHSEQTRGGYHFEDLIPALTERGYKVNMNCGLGSPGLTQRMLHGSWVVLGRYETFDHAIAVCDGYVIDSILHKVRVPYHFESRIDGVTSELNRLRLIFPTGFQPTCVFNIDMNGDRDVEISRATRSPIIIDLRSP